MYACVSIAHNSRKKTPLQSSKPWCLDIAEENLALKGKPGNSPFYTEKTIFEEFMALLDRACKR